MSYAEILCITLVLATIGLLLFADFNRRLNSSRIAAMLALLTIAGADYFFVTSTPFGNGFDVSEPTTPKRQQKRSGRNAGQAHASQMDTESEDRDSASNEATEPMEAAGGTDMRTAFEGTSRSLSHWLKTWLGGKPASTPSLVHVRDFKDCQACPEMVRIRAGVRLIGDPKSEGAPALGLMPQQKMRVWPGYAVARDEITAAQLRAAGITPRGGDTCKATAKIDHSAPAACVTAHEMQSYIGWLNQNTGRRYRLLSAAEWEFAARASMDDDASARHMGGGLAEMVADCWSGDATAKRIKTMASHCPYRVVKDGADAESQDLQNPAVRRPFEAASRSPQIGFRVMRPFDLTAKNGF